MNKISFLGVIVADNCNPNGDPAGGNIPRQDYDGYGLISPDCIKRKLRNRVAAMGNEIFCQNNGTVGYDGYRSLAERAKANLNLEATREEIAKDACARWYDTRAFGQIIGVAAKKKSDEPGSGVSLGIRGPVSLGYARSVDIVNPQRIEIGTSALQSERKCDLRPTPHCQQSRICVYRRNMAAVGRGHRLQRGGRGYITRSAKNHVRWGCKLGAPRRLYCAAPLVVVDT